VVLLDARRRREEHGRDVRQPEALGRRDDHVRAAGAAGAPPARVFALTKAVAPHGLAYVKPRRAAIGRKSRRERATLARDLLVGLVAVAQEPRGRALRGRGELRARRDARVAVNAAGLDVGPAARRLRQRLDEVGAPCAPRRR